MHVCAPGTCRSHWEPSWENTAQYEQRPKGQCAARSCSAGVYSVLRGCWNSRLWEESGARFLEVLNFTLISMKLAFAMYILPLFLNSKHFVELYFSKRFKKEKLQFGRFNLRKMPFVACIPSICWHCPFATFIKPWYQLRFPCCLLPSSSSRAMRSQESLEPAGLDSYFQEEPLELQGLVERSKSPP